MRRLLALASLLVASVAQAAGLPPGSCPAGQYWTRSYSVVDTQIDPIQGTTTAATYSVTAPCFVTWQTDFVITTQVVDSKCASGTVGAAWKVTDTLLDGSNAVSTIGGLGSPGYGGVGLINVTSATGNPPGLWTQAVPQRYEGVVTNHAIRFSFIPRKVDDCSVPVMGGFSPNLIGTTTYDPLPEDPGVVPTPPAPAAAADSGGCGSSGVTPALLGLAALAAAAWPRRRARG